MLFTDYVMYQSIPRAPRDNPGHLQKRVSAQAAIEDKAKPDPGAIDD